MSSSSPSPEPLHHGELSIQERLGVRESVARWAGRAIRDHMPDQHRSFFESLPFLVVGARDGSGRPWVSVLEGPPGFIRSPDARSLCIDSELRGDDPLFEAMHHSAAVGAIGIEFATRRRNRVNGHLRPAEAGWALDVSQSFGNCPKFIKVQKFRRVDLRGSEPVRFTAFDAPMVARICAADTWFIASGHPDVAAPGGMDASHRGGPPGFVEVRGERTLLMPDYSGNNLFNTLGNLMLDPRAGLLLLDFETGDIVQMTGRTTIVWDAPLTDVEPRPQRWIVFELEEGVLRRGALSLRAIDAHLG